MNKIICVVLLIGLVLLSGCNDYHTNEDFCKAKGYSNSKYLTDGTDLVGYSIYCYNYDFDSRQMNVSRIYIKEERLKQICCCD